MAPEHGFPMTEQKDIPTVKYRQMRVSGVSRSRLCTSLGVGFSNYKSKINVSILFSLFYPGTGCLQQKNCSSNSCKNLKLHLHNKEGKPSNYSRDTWEISLKDKYSTLTTQFLFLNHCRVSKGSSLHKNAEHLAE